MKLIILLLTSCLLVSFPLLTMEQSVNLTHRQKRARIVQPVVIKQEENDYEVEAIKIESEDIPIPCAQSSDAQGLPNLVMDVQNALFSACRDCNINKVRELLQKPNINFNTEQGAHALYAAIQNRRRDIVQLLLDETNIDVNYQSSGKKKAALTAAIALPDVEIVKMLLAKPGIDVNIQASAKTPLMLAAHHGHDEIVRLLLSRPTIAINAQGRAHTTALMCAVIKGRTSIVKLLLEESDIDENMQDDHGKTALMLAAEHGHDEIVKMLLSKPTTKVNIQNTRFETALSLTNRIEIVRMLLERRDLSSNQRARALADAAQHGRNEIVTTLLEGLQSDNPAQEEAFRTASIAGQKEIIEIILHLGSININARDKQGGTALMNAACNGFHEIVKLLLERPEIAVNIQDHHGWTALMVAAKNGHEKIVQMLLAKPGLDINAQNRDGFTALMLPVRDETSMITFRDVREHFGTGHKEIIQMLVGQPNITINAQNRDGCTALMLAAKKDLYNDAGAHKLAEIVQLLLAKPSIDLETQNFKGETALTLAMAHKNVGITRMLIMAGASIARALPGYTAGQTNQVMLDLHRAQAAIPVPSSVRMPIAQPAQANPVPQSFENFVKAFLDKPELLEHLDPNTIISPLLLAAKCGDLALVKRLLERHADSAIRDHHGNTGLHLAIIQGHTTVALSLIESTVAVNLQNNLGQTPLMLAAKFGNVDIQNSLLAKGADQLARDSQGKTYKDYLSQSARSQQLNGSQSTVM